MLDYYPDIPFDRAPGRVTFAEWLAQGYFTPNPPKSFNANRSDILTSLFWEVELFQNHAVEQFIELVSLRPPGQIRSHAWGCVTLYYLAFFLAQAFVRLVGKPTLFVSPRLAGELEQKTGLKLNPGSYCIQVQAHSSASTSDYTMKVLKQKHHDAIWVAVTTLVESATQQNLKGDEALMFDYLLQKGLRKYYDNAVTWPSNIRNKTNYLPGFAYTLANGKNVIQSLNFIGRWANCHTDPGVSRRIWSPEPLAADLNSHVRILHDFTFTLYLLVRTLYGTFLARRQVDRTFEKGRMALLKKVQLDQAEFGFLLLEAQHFA